MEVLSKQQHGEEIVVGTMGSTNADIKKQVVHNGQWHHGEMVVTGATAVAAQRVLSRVSYKDRRNY